MHLTHAWLLAIQALGLAVPLTLGLAAGPARRAAPLSMATAATLLTFALAALFALGVGVASTASAPLRSALVRLDAISAAMLLLVTGLGAVIARYSRSYLAGDPGQRRYARALLVTLAAVTTVVIANNLLVIAVAWTVTSLGLHRLLTFYGDRRAAIIAAHKKFLVSRLADVCLYAALALIYRTIGSLDLDAIAGWIAARGALPPTLQVAAGLGVIAAALKSAQLPFHGWLTQVMEAPTPVSALLHAGVVNLGGFLMIRLAPLMAQAPTAQLLLVVIGMTTTVFAALVSTTRVSVKVALAWSTCAQMGFMLVECGLGAWHLALLHLLAHSLYKAHAFLGAGTAVEAWRQRALAAVRPGPSLARVVISAGGVLVAAVAAVAIAARLGGPAVTVDAPVVVLALVVGLALIPMVASPGDALAGVVLRALGVAALYVGAHALAGQLWPSPAVAGAPTVGWAIVAAGFVALFAIQTALQQRPDGALAHALHGWLFAGLYLDERFTRWTFRLWPARLAAPATARPRAALTTTDTAEITS